MSLVIKTVGSICSGIEAASVAWKPLGVSFEWFSEIATFQSAVLKEKFPNVPNLGDMNEIPKAILEEQICAPDLICGGTPCQAFSLAGRKKGLSDERGNLALKFVDIIEANDIVRVKKGLPASIVFWENVEGVLTDKTNAFGCLLSELAGFDNVIKMEKWASAGVIKGPKRNIAWRVLDAKFFGLPQQRRRLYVLAGGKDFAPENVLFEVHNGEWDVYPSSDLLFEKDGHQFQVFREYSDCLYSAYGTKWNGNAAAYNGSLFVVQDNKIRRLSPLECERLMGFPDNYTDIAGARRTNRYQAIGNSWAVPVVQWIGKRLLGNREKEIDLSENKDFLKDCITEVSEKEVVFQFMQDKMRISDEIEINCSIQPEHCAFASLRDIVSPEMSEQIFISPVGCAGILRRRKERNLSINKDLEKALIKGASVMSESEIEKRSLVQKRGKYSKVNGETKVLAAIG